MPEAHAAPELPRREFLKRVGAASIALSLGAAESLAQTPAAKPDAAAAPAPATPPAPSADALALAGILQRRFPDRLSAAEWEGVTRSLDQRLDSGKRLRAAKLANSDEPDFTFRA